MRNRTLTTIILAAASSALFPSCGLNTDPVQSPGKVKLLPKEYVLKTAEKNGYIESADDELQKYKAARFTRVKNTVFDLTHRYGMHRLEKKTASAISREQYEVLLFRRDHNIGNQEDLGAILGTYRKHEISGTRSPRFVELVPDGLLRRFKNSKIAPVIGDGFSVDYTKSDLELELKPDIDAKSFLKGDQKEMDYGVKLSGRLRF